VHFFCGSFFVTGDLHSTSEDHLTEVKDKEVHETTEVMNKCIFTNLETTTSPSTLVPLTFDFTFIPDLNDDMKDNESKTNNPKYGISSTINNSMFIPL